jgi:hypothetical protein
MTAAAAICILPLLLLVGSRDKAQSAPAPTGGLAGFSALAPIDAHAHVFVQDPAFVAFLKRLNLRIINICVVVQHGRGYDEAAPLNRNARAASPHARPRGMVLHI